VTISSQPIVSDNTTAFKKAMNKEKNDITRSIISESDIRSRMGRIFSDALILDSRFNIVTVSRNVCETLGYRLEELRVVCFRAGPQQPTGSNAGRKAAARLF
jgi:hypothetical protein